MRVEIWSDIACPWCYVGKARFEKALRAFPHRDDVEVVHRSFELDPGRAKGDIQPVITMLTRKYGMSEAQARAGEENLGTQGDPHIFGSYRGYCSKPASSAITTYSQPIRIDIEFARFHGDPGNRCDGVVRCCRQRECWSEAIFD